MAISKSKLSIKSGKMPAAKLGASTSSSKSPLMPRGVKVRKGKGSKVGFGDTSPGFGMTGLTGES